MNRPIFYAIALMLLIIGKPANAALFENNKYEIYYGDANQNGIQDVYFRGLPLFVLIHGEIITPIFVPANASFFMELDSFGIYKAPQALTLSAAQIASYGLEKAVLNVSYQLTDYDGDALVDAVIDPANGLPYFVLAGSADDGYPVMLEQAPTASDESQKESFEAWNGMKKALMEKNYSQALTYFSPGSSARYESVFQILSNEMPDIVRSFRNFKLVSSGDNTAVYAVNRLIGGNQHLYFITLSKQHDGSWKVEAM